MVGGGREMDAKVTWRYSVCFGRGVFQILSDDGTLLDGYELLQTGC